MTTRRPKAHYVFYGAIAFIVLVGIGTAIWFYNQVNPSIATSLTSLNCVKLAADQSCTVTYTLKNETSHTVTTNLNGINGPGPTETHVSKVFAILDDGTSIPIFAGSSMEYTSQLQPGDTVELTDKFSAPLDRTVKTIKILGDSYPTNK